LRKYKIFVRFYCHRHHWSEKDQRVSGTDRLMLVLTPEASPP